MGTKDITDKETSLDLVPTAHIKYGFVGVLKGSGEVI